MIKNKMALLGAVATLGMVGGFTSPAHAIVYNVSGTMTNGGTVNGNFDYTPTSFYTNWNISVVSNKVPGLTQTYNTTSSFVSTTGTNTTSDASNLILAVNGSDFANNNFQLVRLVFNDALTGTLTDATSLVQGSFPALNLPIGSITSAAGTFDPGAINARETINSSGSSVTAVPWETDALSVIGATTLFGFGVWTKRKRKADLSK